MTDKRNSRQNPPDGRGKRPRDPNQLAKWVVEQSTDSKNNATPLHDTETDKGKPTN